MTKTKNSSIVLPEKLQNQLKTILEISEKYYNQSEFIKIAIQNQIYLEISITDKEKFIEKICQQKETILSLKKELNKKY